MTVSILFNEIKPFRQLTDREWHRLVKERAEMIQAIPAEVQFPPLGDVRFVSQSREPPALHLVGTERKSLHELLANLSATLLADGVSLEDQGLFLEVGCRRPERHDDSGSYLVGFLRRGTWVRVDVKLIGTEMGLRWGKTAEVRIREAKLRDIVAEFSVDYRLLLEFMAKELDLMVSRRRRQLSMLERLHADFVSVDSVLTACPKTKRRR